MFRYTSLMLVLPLLFVTGCADLKNVGKVPAMTPTQGTDEHFAMTARAMPQTVERHRPADTASLWSSGRQSLLGDRRAVQRGDILTVVIEIDDKAEISNSSARNRSGSESAGLTNLLGIPQRINEILPDGATMADAFDSDSSSTFSGNGSVLRKEKLTLKIAATVVGVLPNGVLSIQGSQEVRVNYEIRELLVSGYVRPEDISRQNQITYEKIASARISYGGRGQISSAQKPRYGQQVADILLPF